VTNPTPESQEPEAPAAGKRFPLAWVLRIAGSALILSLTFWMLPTQEVWSAIQTLPASIWFFSLAIFLLGHVASAFKWRILIGNREVAPARVLSAHFAGLVANLCLPGAAGGDVVRAGWILKAAEDKAQVALGSLADRVIDTLSLFILACIGGASAMAYAGGVSGALLKMGGVLLLGIMAGVGGLYLLPRLPLPEKVRRVVHKLDSAFAKLRQKPWSLVACFCISLAVQSVFVGVNIMLAKASGLEVATAGWFFAWPLAKLLAVLPVSLGGLGVREASLAALLIPLGAAPAKVVAVGLLWQSILYASGILGAAVLSIGSRLTRRAPMVASPTSASRANP
jgi:glycosyltransferase 2 family protein